MLAQKLFERLQSRIKILQHWQGHHVPMLAQRSQMTKNFSKYTMVFWMGFKSILPSLVLEHCTWELPWSLQLSMCLGSSSNVAEIYCPASVQETFRYQEIFSSKSPDWPVWQIQFMTWRSLGVEVEECDTTAMVQHWPLWIHEFHLKIL